MKFFVKSRGGSKIAVIVEKNAKPKGLVFIAHGMGASKESPYIESFAKSFREKSFIVVRFDNRHSIGESEGDYSDVTFTSSYEDLEDVIAWAKKQDWYMEPFVLVGHSLGAGCILWYGAHHKKEIVGMAPIATTISGKQALKRFKKEDLDMPQDRAFGIIQKLKWQRFKNDIIKYDIIPEVDKFDMPFLMIVGDKDMSTPLEDQMKIYEKVSGPKEIHLIEGAGHTFKDFEHLQKAEKIFKNWIDNMILR